MSDELPPSTHNNPPEPVEPVFTDPIEMMVHQLSQANSDLIDRATKLLDAAGRLPESVDDEEMAKKFTTFSVQIKTLLDTADGRRKEKVRDMKAFTTACNGFFDEKIVGKLAEIREKVRARNQAYLDKVAAAQKAKDDAEAARLADEAKRKAEAAAAALAAAQTDQEVEGAIEAAAVAEAAQQTATAAAAAPRPASTTVKAGSGASAGVSRRWKGTLVDRSKLDLKTLLPHLTDDNLQMAINKFVSAMGDNKAEGVILGGGAELKLVSSLTERGSA